MCPSSVVSDFRNLRRAGTEKNRSATLTVVPTGKPAGFTETSLPLENSTRVPSASDGSRDSSSRRETDAMVGSASPRKPSVEMASRSSAVLSLLVAWRSKASSASSCVMPWPSSMTRIMRLPPASVSMRTVLAPASSAFSSNSFTTEAGRSTTSPAAILLATASGNMRIRLIIPASNLLRLALGGFLQSDAQLVELGGVDFGGRFGHEVLGSGGLAEGDDLANRFFTGQKHHDSVDAQRDAAVRRGSVGERIQEEAEAFAQLLLAEAESLEKTFLDVLTVDPDAAGAELVAVQH